MTYEYLTESASISIDRTGRKGSLQLKDVDAAISDIGSRFNELASEGWEFMQIGDMPVTGQTLKSDAYRVVAVAVFRRPLNS